MPIKSPTTFGLTSRPRAADGSAIGGKLVLATYRDHELLAELEFTPRQWISLMARGGTIIAKEILCGEQIP